MSEENKAIVLQSGGDFLVPAAALQTVLATYQAKKEFISRVLDQGIDYGEVPGSTKKTLLKPGAEKMASFFGLAPIFEDVATVEDWTGADHGGEPFFYYRQKCRLFRGERQIASADGSCNSWEKKYRYRSSSRVCPTCGKATIIQGKAEYGGGWICFAKKGGCGAKFKAGDKSVEGQQTGEVHNPDVAEQVNTILKMAQKRALVAAVLIATNASDYFTQDVEDFAVNADWVDAEVKPIPEPAPKVIQTPQANNEQTEVLPPDAAMTYETAVAVVNSNGVAYGELETNALAIMLNSIEKAIKAGKYSGDELTDKLMRRDAMRVILMKRAEAK